MDVRLSTELPFGTHLACHTRYFGREGAELVHLGVDGVLQLQNFAVAHFHCDFAR